MKHLMGALAGLILLGLVSGAAAQSNVRVYTLNNDYLKACNDALTQTAPAGWSVELVVERAIPVLLMAVLMRQGDVGILPGDIFSTMYPQGRPGALAALGLPYTFRDLAHVAAFLRSDIYAEMAKTYPEGIMPIAGAYAGTRHVLGTRAWAQPEQIAGAKLATASPFWSSAGATIMSLPGGEVGPSLERRSIDGVETTPFFMRSVLLPLLRPEASRYTLTLVSSRIEFAHFAANSGWFSSQSASAQDAVRKWFAEAGRKCSSERLREDREAVAAMEAAGIKVVDADFSAFHARADAWKKSQKPQGWDAAWAAKIDALK